jgi:hypothetical protein
VSGTYSRHCQTINYAQEQLLKVPAFCDVMPVPGSAGIGLGDGIRSRL